MKLSEAMVEVINGGSVQIGNGSSCELFLPQYRNVEVIAPGTRTGKGGNPHHYLIDGRKCIRVTSPLRIINKPALVPWAKRLALESARETLCDPSVIEELATILHPERPSDYLPEYHGFVNRLMEKASNRPEEVRDTSAALGTEVHALIQDLLIADSYLASDDPLMVPENQKAAVNGALEFLQDRDITMLGTEVTVWSNDLGIAGTIDGVGRNAQGELVMWDWKRSAGIYWETALQLSAYSNFLSELMGEEVQHAYAVRLLREPPEEGEALYEAKQLANLSEGFGAYIDALGLQRASNVKYWI